MSKYTLLIVIISLLLEQYEGTVAVQNNTTNDTTYATVIIRVEDREFVIFGNKKTWQEAVTYCETEELEIAKIRHIDDARAIALIITKHRPNLSVNLWIAGYRNSTDGTWRWTTTDEEIDDDDELWPDDEDLTEIVNNEDCLTLDWHARRNMATFKPSSCEQQREFVCQKNVSTESTSDDDDDDDDDDDLLNGGTIEINMKKPKTRILSTNSTVSSINITNDNVNGTMKTPVNITARQMMGDGATTMFGTIGDPSQAGHNKYFVKYVCSQNTAQDTKQTQQQDQRPNNQKFEMNVNDDDDDDDEDHSSFAWWRRRWQEPPNYYGRRRIPMRRRFRSRSKKARRMRTRGKKRHLIPTQDVDVQSERSREIPVDTLKTYYEFEGPLVGGLTATAIPQNRAGTRGGGGTVETIPKYQKYISRPKSVSKL